MKFLILGLLFLLPLASAQTDVLVVDGTKVGFSTQALDEAFDVQGNAKPALSMHYPAMTKQFQSLHSFLQDLFGNQRVELYLTTSTGQVEKLGFVMENKQVKSISRYFPTKPTLRVTTDEETLSTIASSSDKYTAFNTAVSSGKLKYEGLDASTQSSVSAVNFGLWISNFIQGFFEFLGFK